MHRVADRGTVIERPVLAQPGAPTVHAHVGDLEHRARPHVRPAGADRGIDQPNQLELGLRAHALRDRA